MKSLAIAMLVMGGLLALVATGFLLRGPSVAAALAVLVPSLSLMVLGGILPLNQERN